MMDAINNLLRYLEALVQASFDAMYDLLVDLVSFFLIKSTEISLDVAMAGMQFSYDVALNMIETLGFNELLSSSYASLDPSVAGMLSLLNFPQAVNMIVSASVTKFVMGKLGVMA